MSALATWATPFDTSLRARFEEIKAAYAKAIGKRKQAARP